MSKPCTIAPSSEVGELGICHLKRFWSSGLLTRNSSGTERLNEVNVDEMLLNALGLGSHQTFGYLFVEEPSFAQFEAWVVKTAGMPDQFCIDRLNAAVCGQPYPKSVESWLTGIEDAEPVLTPQDLEFWKEHGYVVLKSAVAAETRMAAERLIWEHVGAAPDVRDSWYQRRTDHGIMVELIQHPALEANRRSDRIHKAFAQLWGTAELWTSVDRCSFHPPQRPGYEFPGPDLHWDIDFDSPFTFRTQGILYLTDTPPEQGALTVVPGFHRRIDQWHANLVAGADPQKEDLHALGSEPIGAEAGDMVIWHQLLPHGSRPNLGNRPRIAQYINMIPSVAVVE